jgi:transcriptional regulator with XRE-family HTH domain
VGVVSEHEHQRDDRHRDDRYRDDWPGADRPGEDQRERGRDIGDFIRDLRRNAGVSLRQLAEKAGVSNPYLSQIERGLRKPSAEVLQQIAGALRVSTPVMYLRAGLLDARDREGVLAAIAADPDLTMAQKQSLSQIYETFRRENARSGQGTETDQEEPT